MKRAAYVLLRVTAGAVFVYSGYTKLLAPYQDFQAVIHGYRLVTGAPALWLALGLPWLELAAGAFFALGLWTRASLGALWAMNALFLAAVGSALARGLTLASCGCFGEAAGVRFEPSQVFLLDLAILLLFFLLWRSPRDTRAFSLDAYFSQSDGTPRP